MDETLAQLGMDDVGGLLSSEREARVEDLLSARSGVYHAASNAGDALYAAPARGSRPPGTYFLYSNWDFNALGAVFEWRTGRDIYDAFTTDIADPIGLQDQEAISRGTGYGYLWWPRVRADTADALYGSYAAEGAFGQYILVVPQLDMVIAHKVVHREGGPRDQVTAAQFDSLVQAIVSARCHPACGALGRNRPAAGGGPCRVPEVPRSPGMSEPSAR